MGMGSLILWVVTLLSTFGTSTATHRLYGLTRVRNGVHCSGAVSGCTQLVAINETTGSLTNIGHGHTPICPVGDLGVIDSRNKIYYYLGDGWNGTGTILYGIGLEDGQEVCRAFIKTIGEIGIVGGGQSLVADTQNNELLIAGLATKNNGSTYYHRIMSVPMTGGCGPFTSLGSFQDADYEPMAHGSEIDVEGRRLFVTLASSEHAYSMGVVALPSGSMSTIPMTQMHSMWGPVWVPPKKKMFGLALDEVNECLDWRSLDPDTGNWTSNKLKMAQGSTIKFDQLWGNLGSVRAHDYINNNVYVLIGKQQSQKIHLGKIDMGTGSLTSPNPPQLNGDTGWSGEILMQLALQI
jgi:hypothetical protein